MQVGSAVRPITVARPAAQAAQAAARAASTDKPVAAKPAASKQGQVSGLLSLGMAVANGVAAFVDGAFRNAMGMVTVLTGGWNAYEDIKGLKKAGNNDKSDDKLRLAGDGMTIAGGAALLGGGLLAGALGAWVPVVGAGLAMLGVGARILGVKKDDTRS